MAELFLKIVNMSIAAGWLVLVVAIVRLLLKKAPKWVNPLLWGIVGLRLVLPFSIESVLSLIPSAEPISPEIMYMPEPVITTGFPVVNEIVNPVITESFAPKVGASVNPLQVWIFIASCIWVIGVSGMLLYTMISYLLLRYRVRTSVHLCRNIYQSEKVETPFVLGIVSPRIYLPFRLEEEDLAYVISHEESHIHRRDNWMKPLGFLLLSVYWFHPLIWLGYILFCRDIELACDERVIKEMNHEERADYSQALLNCSVSRQMLSASPLTFSEVDVKERVKRVLTYKKPAFLLTVTAVCVCGVIAVCFLTNPKTISATGEDGSIAKIGGADGPTDIYLLPSEEPEDVVQIELDEEFCRKWGEIQYAYYLKYDEVRGDLLKEYEHHVQMATEYYRLRRDTNPEASAQDYVRKQYALYLAASEGGYAVAALDVMKYLYSLKESVNSASDAVEIRAMIEAFPSEDDYWDYKFTVCEKELPVQQYLEDKAEAFAKEKGMETTSSEFAAVWAIEKERITQEAVEKYFSIDGNMEADTIPLEKETVLAAIEKSGLEAVLSDEETRSARPGQVSYSLRSDNETYENTGSPVLVGSVTYTVNDAWGRAFGASFLSASKNDNSDAVFSWDDWKKQLAFSAILYGGFENPDEIYEVFSGMGLPVDKGYSWDAQLSGGYCQIEWRDSGTSQTQLSVLIYENKAYFDAYQEQRQKVARPFLVEVTSAEIVENNDGKKELALSVAIENDTDQEWQDVWFECTFNREAGAFIADHFVNGYESDKVDVVAAKNDETSDIHGLEYEWHIPLTTEEDLAYNYDYLSMEDINSTFKEITVTVHAFGKKQIVVLPLNLAVNSKIL